MLVTLGGQGLITRKSLVYAHYKWNLAFKYFSSSLVESVVESTNTEADGIYTEELVCVSTAPLGLITVSLHVNGPEAIRLYF